MAEKVAKPRRRRRWIRPAVFAIIAYVLLRWFEYSQVYRPSREWAGTPKDAGLAFEDLALPVGSGDRVSAWFIPAPSPGARVVIVCHGNAGNISHRVDFATILHKLGLGVMLFDYRGYGQSSGRPGEERSYEDAQTACHWLRNKGVEASKIVAYGESLGGGVAAELAAREKVGGVVLQSAFTSVPDLGAELFPFLPVRWLATIRYDTRGKLPSIHVPVLVMHSRADTLIPFHHAERNFAAANNPKQFWEIAGDHNDEPYADEGKFRKGLETFLGALP
jgi:fermentation-respiration switch protein FrsA (DUF1100 family)